MNRAVTAYHQARNSSSNSGVAKLPALNAGKSGAGLKITLGALFRLHSPPACIRLDEFLMCKTLRKLNLELMLALS